MRCPLPEISAYSFENELGRLGKLIRHGNKPLSQFCRRINELMYKNIEKATIPRYSTS